MTLAALCGGSWLVSQATDPWRPAWTVWGPVRVALTDGRLSVCNTDYPYSGSIISVTMPGGPPPRMTQHGCNFPVYFRYFGWADHSVWVMTVPLLPAAMLFGLTAWMSAWPQVRAAQERLSS